MVNLTGCNAYKEYSKYQTREVQKEIRYAGRQYCPLVKLREVRSLWSPEGSVQLLRFNNLF
jgi:hypothetical protein